MDEGFYIPYSGKKPKIITVNGHRLVVVTRDKELLEDRLEQIGADRVRLLLSDDITPDCSPIIRKMAKTNKAGIVYAPGEAELNDVLKSLAGQLPWLQ